MQVSEEKMKQGGVESEAVRAAARRALEYLAAARVIVENSTFLEPEDGPELRIKIAHLVAAADRAQ